MSLSTVVKYFSLTWEITKSNILSAMEYRVSFLLQVVGMIVNDFALLALWLVFFQKFPLINGWGFQDSVILFAITTVGFGITMTFARGASEISKIVSQGELDYFLTFPKNVLWHTLVSKTDISAIGDFVFGIMIFFFFGDASLEKTGLFFLMSIFSGLIFLNFTVIVHSITFFVGNFEGSAEQLFHSLLGFTLYPQTTFYGALKMIMMTIIPAFFVSTLPVQLVQQFDWKYFLILVGFWIFTSILAISIFNRGLRKYESGNLINVKM